MKMENHHADLQRCFSFSTEQAAGHFFLYSASIGCMPVIEAEQITVSNHQNNASILSFVVAVCHSCFAL